MKKIIFLLILLFILTFSGCDNKKPNDGTTQESSTEKPSFEEVVTILDQKQTLDEAGILSYIQNEYIEDDMMQQLSNFQENILLSSSSYNGVTDESSFKLELISTQTGELISKVEYNLVDVPMVQILDRHLAVSDMVSGKVMILDENLKQEKEYEVEKGNIFLNKKMTKAYVLDQKDGILVVDLAEGTRERMMTEMESTYISKVCGDYITLVYTDAKTGLSGNALLNLEAEEVDILDLNKSFYAVEHNSQVWFAGIVGEFNQYLLGTEDAPHLLRMEAGFVPSLVPNSDEIIVSRVQVDESMDLTAYSSDGTYLSKVNIPFGSMGYWNNIVKFDSLHGYLLTSVDEQGLDKLYYWDTRISCKGENLNLTEMTDEIQSGDAVSEELYEKARKIGEKHGVTIKIADQCETEYSDYKAEQNLNGDKISRGLDIIDLSLSSYPEGFLEQLHFGYLREIEINLMGDISARHEIEEDKNGFDSFVAFVEQNDEKHMMVFDLSRGQLMEQDLYHEISHLIDKKLQNMVDNEKEIKFSEEGWAALNPSDFAYCQDYTDVPDAYYYDGYDDYFIDIYSRTFPSEDRARILEYAMIGAEFCFDTYPGLVEKLDYYAQCIRDGFDTTGWPEVTKWEEMLFLVD